MGKLPYSDRLIMWLKDAIKSLIVYFVGIMIAYTVAARYPQFSAHWWMTVVGMLAAYLVVLWLLQLAWSRYRRSSN